MHTYLRSLFLALLAIVVSFVPAAPASAAQSLPGNVTMVTPSDIVARIENSSQPFTLFVFASWCPYCKQQIELFNQLLPGQRAQLPKILAVSIDADPEAFSRFMATYSGLFFETRLYQGKASLETLLHNYASEFNGGIPYLAVFQNKKIIKQYNGLIDPMMLSPSP